MKKRKKLLDNDFVYFILLAMLVAGAIFGLFMAKDYTGFAGTQTPAEAGTITTILIDDRQATPFWGGLFGLVFSQSDFNEDQTSTVTAGQISSFTVVFSCVDPNQAENEMYASRNNSINFSNLKAGTAKMIDEDYLNLSNLTTEKASSAFTQNISILVGSTNISGIPAVYTYVSDSPDPNKKFYTGILNDSGRLALVTKVFASTQAGFKGTKIDYQIMLPVKNNSATWYFFADPNDVCPAGFGSGQIGDSNINGYVLESNSSIPIQNATVSAGGNSSVTNSEGFFNFTSPGGVIYSLVAIKDGYVTNITTINTTIGATTTQNLTMAKFFGFTGPNATISGYVRDNSSSDAIANATISVAGTTTLSNATGNYSFIVSTGTYVIAAVKNGYQNFVGNFSISASQNLSFIINMSAVITAGAAAENGTLVSNGTIQGFVTDNSTGSALENVTVTVAGSSNLTNSTGFYNITALSGTTNLVATKDGYNAYFKEINITANNITILNFSMGTVAVAAAGAGNGSVLAAVKTSSGSTLSGVSVSVAGKSNSTNSTGQVLLKQVPAGTHNLVATRSGYNNYATEINITENQQTNATVTMITTTEAGLGAGSGAGKGSGSGAGKGAGQGPGSGAGTGVQAQIQQPTEIVEYEISVKKILKKLKVGNFIGVPITISNFKTDSMDLRFSLEGDIKKMARIDKERLIIDGGSSGEVMLTLLGNVEPGVYEGYFSISGDVNEQIPIYVLVLEKERLSVESLVIKITPVSKRVYAGDLFKYTVDLQNLLSEEKYKVSLSYSVNGINSNRSFFLEKEEIAIHTSFSLLKSFKVPDDLGVGDYALKIKADFLDLNAEHSAIFTVTEPIYMYSVLGIPLWILALLIGTLSTGTFSVVVYKKRKEEKKRYKIELDYGQLPKAGPRSAFVGNIAETSNKAYFDLDQFQVHTLIAGASGSGKSIVAQELVEEALLKGVAVIVFDPTAQWTGFLRRLEDKKLLNLYKNYGMKKTEARAFNGNIRQVTDARELIEFSKFMKPSEINIFVTNKLETKDIELFVANTIRQVFHANLPESKELKYLMVYDGVHSLLPKFGGSGNVFTPIERATREFRKWGVGLILISQVLSDFPPEVLANINTEVQLRTRDEGDLNRTKEKYGEKILQSVVKAAVGTGVIQNSAYNKGKPYFISFRPPLHGTQRLNDEDLENYNKYNEMIDDLDYQLEQLEKESIDAFDLRLELKLSQDKVKSGNFNMVNIYLDGLRPRIKAQWDKLGKTPKKKEIKYISEGELEGELEKAKVERKKYLKENEKTSETPKETGKEAEHTNQNQDIEAYIADLTQQIQNLAENNEKQKAIALYAKVQEIYKSSPNEIKAKILGKCVEIQKILSKR